MSPQYRMYMYYQCIALCTGLGNQTQMTLTSCHYLKESFWPSISRNGRGSVYSRIILKKTKCFAELSTFEFCTI